MIWPHCITKALSGRVDQVGGEIAETQNALVEETLALCTPTYEITHLWWLEDDVIPSSIACLLQLYNQSCRGEPKQIISGVYFSKEPGGLAQPLIFKADGRGPSPYEPIRDHVPQRPFEVAFTHMGCTLIEVEVYRVMAEKLALGHDRYGSREWYRSPGKTDNLVENCDIGYDQNGVYSIRATSDAYFCQQARKAGFKVWVDPHEYAFCWHFDKTRGLSVPEEQWRQSKAKKTIVWQTKDGLVEWPR
jgi:hypothetical protein